MTKTQRKEVEDLVFEVFSTLDRTGKNAELYKSNFKAMDDKQFEKYFKDMFADEEHNFYLEVTPDNEPKLPEIMKALKIMDIPANEEVYFKRPNGKTIRTPNPVPVGFLSIKRLQQIISKKNIVAPEAAKRNTKTGALIGDDKAGRISDTEMFALTTVNAKHTKKEYLSARADNIVSKNAMLSKIAEQGYVHSDDLDVGDGTALTINYVDMLLLSAGITSDLVTNTLLLKANEKDL